MSRGRFSRYIEGESALLSPAEEAKLTRQYVRTRDPVLEERLVLANLRLVVPIARRYCRDLSFLGDLIQEGNLGLLTAVRKYDPDRGVRFATYATYWIRAYILKATLNNLRLVKVGTKARQRRVFFGLGRERRRLTKNGVAPDAAKLARRFDMSEGEFAQLTQHLAQPESSIDAPLRGASDATLADLIPAANDLRPDVLAERHEEMQRGSELRAQVAAFADRLSPREGLIIRSRWLTEAPTSLARLGRRLGISRERVRQLEKRCRQQFRSYLEHPPEDTRISAMGA